MNKSDTDAPNDFMSKLRRLQEPEAAIPDPPPTPSHVVVNRPVRCTIVIGGQARPLRAGTHRIDGKQ